MVIGDFDQLQALAVHLECTADVAVGFFIGSNVMYSAQSVQRQQSGSPAETMKHALDRG